VPLLVHVGLAHRQGARGGSARRDCGDLSSAPPDPCGANAAVSALVLLLFGVLTVKVNREAVRLRFGIGLIRRTVPLTEVRSWRPVRNPWYVGWGMRLGPGWTLWNVSGLSAVELALADGRRFRIGTDEPEALSRAIARNVGHPPADPADVPPVSPRNWKAIVLVVAAVVVVMARG
jgi:hypothetical protein